MTGTSTLSVHARDSRRAPIVLRRRAPRRSSSPRCSNGCPGSRASEGQPWTPTRLPPRWPGLRSRRRSGYRRGSGRPRGGGRRRVRHRHRAARREAIPRCLARRTIRFIRRIQADPSRDRPLHGRRDHAVGAADARPAQGRQPPHHVRDVSRPQSRFARLANAGGRRSAPARGEGRRLGAVRRADGRTDAERDSTATLPSPTSRRGRRTCASSSCPAWRGCSTGRRTTSHGRTRTTAHAGRSAAITAIW